ncbi:RNA polymerase sigma factor, sigma-70 family [Clostridium sp. USBA 49]|uniref:sigma factor-like helix-turn-helix DNA-binding protein n=1 Tax=Clostridium sp. USBA 49 TaxID=1881060 RepID=UPI00099971D5|nr:sigma factor-like helix-turn-helix DNA-binding protein [Clostridium sp. USBA 49]SKA75128.1 RNA polymerase sigma factor, sigma-70 family [Clostridium sp. USBA 49]
MNEQQYYQKRLIIYVLSLLDDFYDAAIIEKNTEIILDKIDVENAIKTLTSAEKSVLYNLYVRGYTVRETAKIMDKSIGTVSKLSNSALDKIVNYCM